MRRPLLAVLLSGAALSRSYAPQAVPKVVVFPRSIALGGTGAIEVQVEMPLRGGSPQLSAALGSIGPATLQDGLWVARYKPPESSAPGHDVLLARSASGAIGVATIELIAKATIPVRIIKPGSTVTVEIAGRTYGPRTAGNGGTVDMEVEVPPGVEEAEVTTESVGVPALHTKEPLTVPRLRHVLVLAPAFAKPATKLEAIMVGVDEKGDLLREPAQVELKGSGQVRSLSEAGPGVWRAEIVPGGGPLAVLVRMGRFRSRASISVPWTRRTRPTPTPPTVALVPPGLSTPTPTPAAPPAPSCEQLHLQGGGITTTAKLREEIDQASREDDLVVRRDRLLGLACVFPDEQSIRLQLAASWLLLGDNTAAIEAIQPVLDDEGETHDDHRALGLSYRASAELRLGELDQAIEDAKAAESLLPGLYSATYVLGEADYLKKDFGDALAALLSAYKAAPEFAGAEDHAMLAELLEAKGDLPDALLHRLAGARFDSNLPEAWRSAARLAESARSWSAAYQAWSILAAATIPGMPSNSEAAAGVARAAAASPADPGIAPVEAALAAERKADLARALDLLERGLAADRENLVIRWQLVRILHAAGKDERASTEVALLLDRVPHWAPALLLAGDIWAKRGDWEKASSRYQEAATQSSPLAAAARTRLAVRQAGER